jgi:hypothetical protein
MVGVVRWCRNHPRIKENLSGGVGFVRWCRIGLWDKAWDFLGGWEACLLRALFADSDALPGPALRGLYLSQMISSR